MTDQEYFDNNKKAFMDLANSIGPGPMTDEQSRDFVVAYRRARGEIAQVQPQEESKS